MNVDLGGLRGSSSTRIDEKGRLKVPADFRAAIGADLFVTSLTGECVRVYPMAVWQEIERKLSLMPANHPSRLKFLDRVSYYGQTAVMDAPLPAITAPSGNGSLPSLLSLSFLNR